jgi:UDP-3-O-[3-hydroxymyristoyl] glucosamine N-acyltransferase
MKARDIAALISGQLIGNGDREISSVADLHSAGPGQLAFAEDVNAAPLTRAGCVIVPSSKGADGLAADALIVVPDPKLVFAIAAAAIHPPPRPEPGVHPSAIVAEDAEVGSGVSVGPLASIGSRSSIGDGTSIGAGARIGAGAVIGDECVLHANVVVEDGCIIGDRVALHSGVKVGADGFGYVRSPTGEHVKFPQIGTVVIEDDVEIGANTCIDRGALGETRIGAGTKIDNLVQVGHNVQIGKRVIIAAQTGISGSVVIEDDCVIGGQVGFGDHVLVKSGAVIGSQAGVLPHKIVRPGVWWGTPIQPLEQYKRRNAVLKSIERMRDEIRELKRRLNGAP